MLVEAFDLLARGGIMKKPVSWWRDGPDGLNMEQPTEVPYDNPITFQSLVNKISQGTLFSRGKMTLK